MHICAEIQFPCIGFQNSGSDGIVYRQAHFFVLHLTDCGKSEIAYRQTAGIVDIERLPCFRDVAAPDIEPIHAVGEFVQVGSEQSVAHQCSRVVAVRAAPMTFPENAFRKDWVRRDFIVPQHIILPEKFFPVEIVICRKRRHRQQCCRQCHRDCNYPLLHTLFY